MKKLSAIIILMTACLTAAAQSEITVEAPNVVAADEQFNVTFILEGENSPSDFSWEHGNDFQLIWGPQTGKSTSIRIINGKRSKSSQHTYTYILMPTGTGTFTLPAAVATVKGKKVTSGTTRIEVVGNSSSSAGSGQPQSGSSSGSAVSGGSVSDEDIFLRLSLSRTEAVVGEPIEATLKLYQRVNVAGFEDAGFPDFNGFWSQETEAPTNIEFQRESLNDKIYNAAVLRKYILIPQQTGTITIDPAELVCLINVRVTQSAPTSIFDEFFNNDYRTIRKRVTSSARSVKVSPLPSGAPASFGGGVGSFKVSAKLSRDTLTTHEAASLTVTVQGRGNVSLLEAPKVSFPPDVEVYDTKISEKIDRNTGGTVGSKTFEFPFIPRSHGDFEIPSVKYSYYDIGSKRYITAETGPLPLHVRKGKETGGTVSSLPAITGQTGVRNLNEDIRYIGTKFPKFFNKGDFYVFSAAFWIWLAGLAATAVALYFGFRKIAARRADVAGTRNRKATKMALRRLHLAEQFLRQNLYTAFYEELHKALLGFASDKLNIPSGELSKEGIAEAFRAQEVPEELYGSLISLIDACEFARYSPDSGHEAMQKHYDDAIRVISTTDTCMKNRKGTKNAAAAVAVALLFMPAMAGAAEDDYIRNLWDTATSEYSEGKWEDALKSYEGILDLGLVSAPLYTNIGDCRFKMQDIPGAILYYERALKLSPAYDDARYNLQVASSMIQDRIDPVPEFILKAWARQLCYSADTDTWAWISIIFFALTLAMVLLFLLGATPAAKKTGFFTGIAALLLFLSALSFSVWQRTDYMTADSAIVMRPVAAVKSSPSSETSTDLFILHEGTKVIIIDEVGQWRNIELADGRQGWMKTSDMEII